MSIDTIKIELPSINVMKKIRIRLDIPRVIEYKDGRKVNNERKTLTPKELKNYKGVECIYFFCREEKILYIGQTNDLNRRIQTHSFIIKNKDIKFVYFYEMKEPKKRKFFEMIYKYYYLNKIDFEETSYLE